MTATPPRVAILAGGRSARFAPGGGMPKALACVGDRTLLDHVVDRYVVAGHRAIVIALGHHRDALLAHLAPDTAMPADSVLDVVRPDGVHLRLVDTGTEVGTGGRVLALRPHLANLFHLAWCDGLLDVAPAALEADHADAGALVTMVAAHPPTRYGRIWLDGDRVVDVAEKPLLDDVWASAGMFVVDRRALVHADGPAASWEEDVLPRLAKDGDLTVFRHEGFWATIDTPEDLDLLARTVGDATPWRPVDGVDP